MKLALFCAASAMFAQLAAADDGIWLLNEFPRAAVAAKYKFKVTDEFLKNLQLGSVRFNNGGSGSFVSAEGLVFTNHHVGADCIQKLSTKEADYMKQGFHAKTRGEERKCPDLELNVLLSIENVTERVKATVPVGSTAAEAAVKRRAEMSAIEKQCADRTKHRCDVVTLFSGGQYHLYQYQKYTDIRLVFAPEKDIAFFGGDPDNFTYPRWNLDITFFRVYQSDKPVQPLHHFPWSQQGAKKGELQFVSGNPGTTGRLLTMAELEVQRDVILPLNVSRLESLIAVLKKYSARGPEEARVALEEIFGTENSYKALSGFYSGLKDPAFLARKQKQEVAMKAAIAKDADEQKQYGSVWSDIAAITSDQRALYPKVAALENGPANYGNILAIARQVLRLAVEREKPNGERLREYSDAALESLQEGLFSPAPLAPSLEQEILAEYLRFVSKTLGPSLLGGKSPETLAAEAIAGTKLFDIEERKRLSASSKVALESGDSMLKLVRMLDPAARQVRKEYEDKVQARQAIETARLAQAQYALGGNIYPDATFTFRVSFGPAIGYKTKAGKSVPWDTDFAGMYRHATGIDPFKLPQRWLDARRKLALSTPFNYVTTADTHGGNSGSPSINTKGEIVGILFDGNIEGLPNRYLYTEKQARSVHVASQGIVEALRKIYAADALLRELELNAN